ncbi:desmocollin-2-like [Seriola lalandi dorsalis]|uniref:Desmocollin 2 like n=1 Tax=Seriola lalandi dorsalis TaxID=1841481 RepID=A0A3B4Y449_SERLL|nr:desmocollin-2-like [Seriola lalandi dorsalis]
MANVLIFNICLMMVLSCVDSCFIPNNLYVLVPQTIPAGYEVTKVTLTDCDTNSLHFTLKDPTFTIKTNGEIVAVNTVSVATRGRTFSVWAHDGRGPESEIEVHLVHRQLQKREYKGQGFLKRSKRRWSPPPFNILENDAGPFPKDIEKIVSDSSGMHNVYYTISGPGSNEPPINLFTIDKDTGMLTVHGPIDREVFPQFVLKTQVFDKTTKKETDLPLDVKIDIDDVNDNTPQFPDSMQFTVLEQSKPGTVVGKVNATDKDQEGTLHVKIRYTLLSALNLFAINPQTGVITTVTNTLDREEKDKHLVTVQIQDLDGAVNGLKATGTATITVGDINDNPPTFKETSYTTSINENEKDKLILRIPVEDKDLINTPNWISKFVITKGNENGNFRMETDPKTNEGLLYVSKALNHEQTKNVQLEISARNEAELSNANANWLSIPVAVTVNDVDEGPEFSAPTVRFIVKENIPNGTLIGSYKAIDPETKSSNGIMYYKATDPASWINVDKSTGELRVANTIDRESQFVQNGIYNITMKAVDASLKTGTGTVIIQVEDVNDNVPLPLTGELVICEQDGELGSVLVMAEDKDEAPLSSPFSFSLPSDNDGKWSLTRVNETAATLRPTKKLIKGLYKVPVDIKDLQGFGEVQVVTVRICECRNGVCLAQDRSVSLGGLALLAMLLPLALLLLLFLLLAFFCVTKRDNIDIEDTGDGAGILLASNTEGKGDEVDPSLITVPSTEQKEIKQEWLSQKNMAAFGGQSKNGNGIYNTQTNIYSGQTQYDTQHIEDQYIDNCVDYVPELLPHDLNLLHTWQTNGHYLHQKLAYFGGEGDERYADDIVHCYGFEGVGSAAGSVGCCSDYGDTDNLDFLNTLGPKFKTLADVCKKT